MWLLSPSLLTTICFSSNQGGNRKPPILTSTSFLVHVACVSGKLLLDSLVLIDEVCATKLYNFSCFSYCHYFVVSLNLLPHASLPDPSSKSHATFLPSCKRVDVGILLRDSCRTPLHTWAWATKDELQKCREYTKYGFRQRSGESSRFCETI